MQLLMTQLHQHLLNIDGDFDNGVIAHEAGHGINIRLVGGPGPTQVVLMQLNPWEKDGQILLEKYCCLKEHR